LLTGHERHRVVDERQFDPVISVQTINPRLSVGRLFDIVSGFTKKIGVIARTAVSSFTIRILPGRGELVSAAARQIQSTLNDIWKAERRAGLTRLVRARLAALGLVATLAFLIIVSLVVSACLAALESQIEARLPEGPVPLAAAKFGISVVVLALPFAAVYKLHADRLAPRDRRRDVCS
jgi:uncharacterized BrkB/YihY/UPF0761 family membrane protein